MLVDAVEGFVILGVDHLHLRCAVVLVHLDSHLVNGAKDARFRWLATVRCSAAAADKSFCSPPCDNRAITDLFFVLFSV